MGAVKPVAKFWTSWNLQRHLAEFTERIKDSTTARSLSNEPRRAARAAREHLNVQLAVYAHEIVSVPPRSDFRPSLTVELQRLKSVRVGLDGQDAILRDAMAGAANYKVPMQMWKAVKLVFDGLPADLVGISHDFAFDSQPNV